MNRVCAVLTTSVAIVSIVALQPVMAGEQEAIDGCIDKLRAVGGPDARAGGQVLSSEFSEAATLVMLRDAGGTVWRCLAYSDGTVGELTVSQAADDGGGAMAGASGYSTQEPTTSTERVRFDRGSSGAELTATLTPGSSMRYVLNAKNGQNLYVRVAPRGPDIYYQIFNPDGSFLLEQMDPAKEYRGQLWQSGDHVIEVINRGSRNTSYNVIFGIE
jgi:hypothetical protein